MDRGAWWAVVHGVSKSQTRLNETHSVLVVVATAATARSLLLLSSALTSHGKLISVMKNCHLQEIKRSGEPVQLVWCN